MKKDALATWSLYCKPMFFKKNWHAEMPNLWGRKRSASLCKRPLVRLTQSTSFLIRSSLKHTNDRKVRIQAMKEFNHRSPYGVHSVEYLCEYDRQAEHKAIRKDLTRAKGPTGIPPKSRKTNRNWGHGLAESHKPIPCSSIWNELKNDIPIDAIASCIPVIGSSVPNLYADFVEIECSKKQCFVMPWIS